MSPIFGVKERVVCLVHGSSGALAIARGASVTMEGFGDKVRQRHVFSSYRYFYIVHNQTYMP